MYNVTWICPLDPRTLTHRVHWSDGTHRDVRVPSPAHTLINTYKRVGIFHYINTRTGDVQQRASAAASCDGEFRRATQFEYDRWQHRQPGFSGNALVYRAYFMH